MTPASDLSLGRPRQLALALVAAALFVGVLVTANAICSRHPLPNYGAWTGIEPLEDKLDLLTEFSREGPVDALLLGSSIVDFGFSAERFSELMTEELGREYRAFNFATGGAEPRTLPKLYRLARTVAVPQCVFVIVPPEPKLYEEERAVGPDNALLGAPIGEVLRNPYLLPVSRRLWTTPLARNAPAARDYLMYGELRGQRPELPYPFSDHGDLVSYLMTWDLAQLPALQVHNERAVAAFDSAQSDGVVTLDAKLSHFFAAVDIAALRELRELVEADNGKLVLVSHAGASTLWAGPSSNRAYLQGRREFFESMAEVLGATWLDPAVAVRAPDHHVSDVTHLNTHGARNFARATCGVLCGKPELLTPEPVLPPPAGLFPTRDPTFLTFAALLQRPAGVEHPLLRFRMVKSHSVPVLPPEDLYVALRTPDNTDVVVPAIPLGDGEFVAEVNLPAEVQAESVVFRLLQGFGRFKTALNNPLADYEWLAGWPQRLPPADGELASIAAWPPVRRPGESLYVAVRPDVALPADAVVTLQPQGASTAMPISRIASTSTGMLKCSIPPTTQLGQYTLVVQDPSGRELPQCRQPVTIGITHEEPAISVVGAATIADGELTIRWSGISRPRETDWLGIFPAEGDPQRIRFAFTEGRSAGEVRIPTSAVSSQLSTGQFKLGLYGGKGATLMAESEPFEFAAGDTGVRLVVPSQPRIDAGTLPVGWTGNRRPAEKDWVGLFPAGGADAPRLAFRFVPSQVEGTTELTIPEGLREQLAAGEYEVRMYAAGGWRLLARSGPVTFSNVVPVVAEQRECP